MQILDNINTLWGDDQKETLKEGTKLQIAASCFSIYAFEALKKELEKIYFLMLYNIFNEFLEDLNEDVLPNDLTGYKNSVVWNKLYNFQRDAATGIINKLETYNGCILADSVGLGKTFTALAVIKYYELRNRSVLVLCPKKLEDNWQTYRSNYKTNILAKDRLNYDLLFHTDLSRESGFSSGIDLQKINWGNYDLVVIDESHNFRNNDAYKDKETRYKKLMNSVIRDGVKTKVLMISATPVNNRFNDLRNQLALAYEGKSENLSQKLKTKKSIEEIFKRAQAAFNSWSKLPPEKRTAKSILDALDFDFFELLDSVTIARSRKHIETFYDTTDIGKFPVRRKPLSFRCKLTERSDVMSFNDIYLRLIRLKLSVYAPVSYILPSRLKKYEELYDTSVDGGKGKLKQADREKSLQSLMTTNLLKRLESSVESFRLTLSALEENHNNMLGKIEEFNQSGSDFSINDLSDSFSSLEADVTYRKEQLRRLQEKVIELEDLKTGVNITDLGLNDFRMDLLGYIKSHGDLGHLPSGLHAVVPSKPEIGLEPGVIFTLRNRNSSVNINQHNRLHPYYLIYIGSDGKVLTDHTQVKSLLDLVRNSCKGLNGPIPSVFKPFNKDTRDGREMTQYSDFLGQAIRSMVEVKEDKDIDSLFSGVNTTALVDTIKGLDDFKLIAFLVIQSADYADGRRLEKKELPVVLNMGTLYEALLKDLIPLQPHRNESFQGLIDRAERISKLERDAIKLANRIKKEKQFNRRVALNRVLNKLKAEIEGLKK